MDFKRIQILLAIFFLIFDIYLLNMLVTRADSFAVQSPTQEQQIQTTIEDDLEARGIRFGELSTETGTMNLLKTDQNNYLAENIGQLENQNATIDSNRILMSTFNEPIDLGLDIDANTTGLSEEQYIRLRDEFLSNDELFIEGEQYRSYWYTPTDRTIILRITDGEGNSIVDGTADLRISLDENYNMISYTQTYQGNLVTLPTEVDVMSERNALEILDRRVETYIPDNAQIISNRLSYYRSMTLEDFNVYSPAWEILYYLNDGTSRSVLVDATRGNVINRAQIIPDN